MADSDNLITYGTIAAAESVIQAAGYVRDTQHHIWRDPNTGRTAKVVRANNLQFSVQWG